MTQEIIAATRTAQALIAGPTIITGHSAGGHLAARMACTDVALANITRVIPISPIADLAPLIQTEMNKILHITPEESKHESPAHLTPRPEIRAHIWVGAMERPAFLWHARLLSENWACPWTAAPDKHHFSVIDDLQDPGSALMETLLGA